MCGKCVNCSCKKDKEVKVCPQCNKEYTGVPALSRVDNKTLICPNCGTLEALEAYKSRG